MVIKTIAKYAVIAALFTSLGYFHKEDLDTKLNRNQSIYSIKQEGKKLFLTNNANNEKLEITTKDSKTRVGPLDYRISCIEQDVLTAEHSDNLLNSIKTIQKNYYTNLFDRTPAEKGFAKNYLSIDLVLKRNSANNIETYIADGKELLPLTETMQLGDMGYRVKGLIADIGAKTLEMYFNIKDSEIMKILNGGK